MADLGGPLGQPSGKPDPMVGALSAAFQDEAAKFVLGRLYPFLDRAREGLRRKKQQDVAYFLLELARRTEDEGAEFQQEFLEDCFTEDGTSEVITQALKAALEITDSRMLAVLAHLAFHYQANSKSVDLFFRGLVRLLESVGAAEFEVLQVILAEAIQLAAAKPDDPFGIIGIRRRRLDGSIGVQIELFPGLIREVAVDLTPAMKNLLIATGVGESPSPARHVGGVLTFGDETDLVWSVATLNEIARFLLEPPKGGLPASS